MATVSEVRSHVEQWLGGKISLREFQEWFVPVAGTIHGDNNPDVENLVDDIDMSLSEYSDGILTGRELREELGRLVHPFVRKRPLRFRAGARPQELNIPLESPGRIGPTVAATVLGTASLVESRDLDLWLEQSPAAS